MKLNVAFALLCLRGFSTCISAFSIIGASCTSRGRNAVVLGISSESTTSSDDDTLTEDPLGLTPELRKISDAFQMVGDDKMRHKQLLYMANQLPPLQNPSAVMVPENKVPGCLSTVHIDGEATLDSDCDSYKINYVGDSDGLLTKGLVALLVRGLSGNTAQDIQKVNPEFIKEAGIAASLTPGRNNGFLNMLATMKRKALELEEEATAAAKKSPPTSTSSDDGDGGPMYNIMMEHLQKLQPTFLSLKDNSAQHAGHAGAKGFDNGESHFELDIVSPAFEGLSLVKRHQLIYMILGNDVMDKIHALQITRAKTPDEV